MANTRNGAKHGNRGHSYFRQVNLTIPGIAGPGNTGVQFTFADQPDLRYARTTGLVIYTASDLAICQPDNVAVLTDALLPKVTLVLETNDPDDIITVEPTATTSGKKTKGEAGRFTGTLDTIQWLPASQIHINQNSSNNSFVRQMIGWKDRYIVWQKSHAVIASGGLANTTDLAICLGVFYTFIDEFGFPIIPRN
jgi:hypothetical protein